ncbi:MAG: hypothetical protein ACRDZY_00480 [Acidimicrobiales bacterium]
MAPEAFRSVNDALTRGLVVACYYASHPNGHVDRPDCEGLASVRYGPTSLCRSCDLRRSAVGKGRAPIHLPDPDALVEVMAARDRAAQAEKALARAVSRAREAGHPWSALGTVLGTSRQGAQQRFSRAAQRGSEQ